ncbi:MAG: hypothetical protein J6R06_08355 [Bacteroidales bacterium]|nr:hypothetical protein [Bacteroidales bacterium]
MKTGIDFAECALLPKWDKFTYDELDCQAFVEAVLKEIGIRKTNGQFYNWTGSNSMYRNYYSWRGSISDCLNKYGFIPVGAFVYIHKDSGVPDQYKNDTIGNMSHVGIYCGNDVVRDSTRSTKTHRNGVGTRSLEGFTHITLFTGLDYSCNNSYNSNVEKAFNIIDGLRNKLVDLEEIINELRRS